MFLAIGYKLESHLGPYMTITPLHLLPSTIFISFSIIYGFVLKHRAGRDEKRQLALQDTKASS
jgi:hypothetical protein